MRSIVAFALLLLVACGGETTGSTSTTGGTGGATSCPNDLPASCPTNAPTFANDVAPVIEARCAICHATGGAAADKPLTDHAEIHARRSAVLDQIHGCKMPPEGASPLTTTERLAIEGWLVCGAPDD